MFKRTNTILFIGVFLISVFLYEFTLQQQKNTYLNQIEEVLHIQLDVVEPLLFELDTSRLGEYLYQLDLDTGVRFTLYDTKEIIVFDSRNNLILDEIPTLDEFQFIENEPTALVKKQGESSEWASIAGLVTQHDIKLIQLSIQLDDSAYLNTHFTFVIALFSELLIYIWSLFHLRKKQNEFVNEMYQVLKSISNNQTYVRTNETLPFDDGFSLIEKSYMRINQKYDSRKGQLEAILGSLDVALIAIDLDGKIIFSNRKANALFGTNLSTIQQTIYHVVYDSYVLEILAELKENDNYEIHYVESSTGLLLNYSGIGIYSKSKRIGSLVIVEDVTKVAQLEKLKQDFVSNVTHELKTPLTSIQGFSETLQEMDPNEPKFRDFLKIINTESVRLNGLINDILVLSDLEAKEKQDKRWVDINRVAREVIDLLEIQKKPTVKLVLNAKKNFMIYIDRYQLKQLILNLVSNGLKYTDNGFVTIDLSETKQAVIMKVIDTGIGIPKEEQGRVFERFYRVNKDRSRKTGGTGLGLSIVKHIVENNGAELYLKSAVGEGTTITIEFPTNKDEKGNLTS